MKLKNPEVVRDETARGKPVFLLGAHQCNWEWMLLALSAQLGMPVDAAYKPLGDSWAECELRKLRSRLGARMIPAQELLGDIIKQRGTPRAIAILADQEPKTGERKQWVRFLNRDTAFFMGPEEIARSTRYPAFFLAHQAHARGHYEVEFVQDRGGGRAAAGRRIHGALRAHGRGADSRRTRRLAVVAQALEAQKAAVRRVTNGDIPDLLAKGDRPRAKTEGGAARDQCLGFWCDRCKHRAHSISGELPAQERRKPVLHALTLHHRAPFPFARK